MVAAKAQDDAAAEGEAFAGAATALIEDVGDLLIGVAIEQRVDLGIRCTDPVWST